MHPARRLVFLSAAIAALAAVLALVLPAATASASAVPAAGNRVGASPVGMILAVGASHTVSPGQGRCGAALQAWFAAGACVAAEEADSVGEQQGELFDPTPYQSEPDTFLYQKLSSTGEHLKYGITNNPATRYTADEMNGGSLNILASGPKEEMLALERSLHETLPIGPEEGQTFYIAIQVAKGLRPPPY